MPKTTTTTTTMPFSMSILRYAVSLSIPKFLPIPTFLFRLYSQPPFIHTAVDDVVSSFNYMLRIRPRPPIIEFNKILGILVKREHYTTTISLSQKMEFRGIELDIVTLNILINCFGHLGQMNFAFSLLAKILKKGYQPNTIIFTTPMKGLCLNGDVKKALHFHDDVMTNRFELNVYTYTILMNGLCNCGRFKNAQEVFHNLLVKGYTLSVITYNVMIKGLCKEGLFDEAIALVSKMEDNGCIPNAFTFETIIYGLLKKDENDKAKKLVLEMIAKGLL